MANHSIFVILGRLGPFNLARIKSEKGAAGVGRCPKAFRILVLRRVSGGLERNILAQRAALFHDAGFDDAGVDDVGYSLFGLLFEEDLTQQRLFAGAKEFRLDKGILFIECGKIHL